MPLRTEALGFGPGEVDFNRFKALFAQHGRARSGRNETNRMSEKFARLHHGFAGNDRLHGALPLEIEHRDIGRRPFGKVASIGQAQVTRGIDGEMSRARELVRRAEELRGEGKREKTGIKFWLPAGGILLAGIAALAWGPLIPGLVLAAAGILLLLMAASKEWQKKEQRQKKAAEYPSSPFNMGGDF